MSHFRSHYGPCRFGKATVMKKAIYADREALRVNEAVASTGICRSKLYTLMSEGTLQSVKVGRARLILRCSLDALLTPARLA